MRNVGSFGFGLGAEKNDESDFASFVAGALGAGFAPDCAEAFTGFVFPTANFFTLPDLVGTGSLCFRFFVVAAANQTK